MTHTGDDVAKKPLSRNLGEFFGHIVKAIRTDPKRGERREVRRTVEEEDRGDVVLRRTTIEEVELRRRGGDGGGGAGDEDGNADANATKDRGPDEDTTRDAP